MADAISSFTFEVLRLFHGSLVSQNSCIGSPITSDDGSTIGVATLEFSKNVPVLMACLKSGDDSCGLWELSLSYKILLGFMEDDAGIIDDSEGLKAFAPFFAAALKDGFKHNVNFDKQPKGSTSTAISLQYSVSGRLSTSTLHLEHRQSHLVLGVFDMMHGLLLNATRQPVLNRSSSSLSSEASVRSGGYDIQTNQHPQEADLLITTGTKPADELFAHYNKASSVENAFRGVAESQSFTQEQERNDHTGATGLVVDDSNEDVKKDEENQEEEEEEGPTKKRKIAPAHMRRGRGGVNLFIKRR